MGCLLKVKKKAPIQWKSRKSCFSHCVLGVSLEENQCPRPRQLPCSALTPWCGFPGRSGDEGSAGNAGDLGWEDPLEEGMTAHSNIFAWRIPMDRVAWQAIQSMGLQRVGHNWGTKHIPLFSLQVVHQGGWNCRALLFLSWESLWGGDRTLSKLE